MFLKDIFSDASNKGYAVGVFNITSMTYVDSILDAAEKCKSPVILSI